MSKKQVTSGTKAKKTIVNIIIHIFLAILSFIWVLPIFWVVLTSFRGEKGSYVTTFFPKTYTINNYVKLFTDTSILNFPKMFVNTFIIAIFTCIISTIFVLSVSYTMSRMRFNMRKPFMNVAMILGLFPSFMSMIAAIIDGATRWQVFTQITAPLSKPIIVYTILTSFMGPWVDFIFAKVICRADAQYYTVSIGLWKMLEKEYIDSWYTCFAAGAVVVSIPIAILFLLTQKFYVDGMSGAVKG